MNFKAWFEAKGWDALDDDYAPAIPHQALPPLPGGPPPVAKGMVRLYRGTQAGVLPHESAFFADERGLEGIAKAFARFPGRHLVYVDVPEEVARAGLQTGAVTDGEYKLPEKYRRMVRILH